MTKPLIRIKSTDLYWFDDVGAKHAGNCTGLWGNCTGLSGDCTGIPTTDRPCSLIDWIQEP